MNTEACGEGWDGAESVFSQLLTLGWFKLQVYHLVMLWKGCHWVETKISLLLFSYPVLGIQPRVFPLSIPNPLAFYFETGSHWTAKLPRLISNLRLSCLSLSEYWTYRHFPAHLDCFEFWVQTFSQATDMLSHPILHCWIWSSDAAPSHPLIPGGRLWDSDVQLYWAMECSRLGVLLYFQSRLFLTYNSFVERLRSICIKAARRSFLR